MNSQQRPERSFSPIGMMQAQQIESRIRSRHTQYLSMNLLHLVSLMTISIIKLTDTVFTRLEQKKQTVR